MYDQFARGIFAPYVDSLIKSISFGELFVPFNAIALPPDSAIDYAQKADSTTKIGLFLSFTVL